MGNQGHLRSGRPALQQARSLRVSGLPGAQAFSEYAGATESGAPSAGTFKVGQWVIDRSGSIWLCTVAGSPGTWAQIGGGGGGTIDGAFSLTGSVTPASFGAQQDDYDPADLATASVLRLEGTGGVQLVTGLAAQSDGRVLLVHNIGSFQIRFAHEHTSSAAANRFHFPWGGSGDTPGDEFYLTGNATLTLRYDGTLSRWLVWPGFQSHTHGYDLEGLQLYPDDVEANVRLVTYGELRLSGITSPAQITADQNDYHPGDNQSVYRLSSDASRTITGLDNNQASFSNQIVLLVNVGAQDIVLSANDAGSTAANQFGFDASLTLAADTLASLWYDDTSSVWRLVAHGTATAGAGASALDDLTDVDAPTPGDGDVLTFNNGTGNWEAAAPGGGSVATDAIWDAAGDLAVGTGANTAAKLTIGSEGQGLRVSSGGTLEYAGTKTRLAETILGANTASITFSSISGSYRALQLVVTGRTDYTGDVYDHLKIRFNSDTGSNYDSTWHNAWQSSSAAGGATGGTSGFAGALGCNHASTGASEAGTSDITIGDYARTAWKKTWTGSAGVQCSGTSSGTRTHRVGGGWRDTSAITAITILPSGGSNLLSGTVATLWGLL